MKNYYKMMALCTMCSVLAVACGPTKDEEKSLPPLEEKKPDDLLSYPDKKDLDAQEKGQQPSPQEETLQKDEDNVMNPTPG